jgi:hypothetical protein
MMPHAAAWSISRPRHGVYPGRGMMGDKVTFFISLIFTLWTLHLFCPYAQISDGSQVDFSELPESVRGKCHLHTCIAGRKDRLRHSSLRKDNPKTKIEMLVYCQKFKACKDIRKFS